MADFAQDNEPYITQDPLYSDITPIPQDDGPNPVVAIRYPQKFKDVHNYFRAIIHKHELSERALKLTEKIIELNAANYTAWQYRRECIFKLKSDLFEELEFSEKIARASPKNYQLWWHRRIIIEAINKPKNDDIDIDVKTNNNDNDNDDNDNGIVFGGQNPASSNQQTIAPTANATAKDDRKYDLRLEKELLRDILKSDGKNYHAWSHYHWLLKTYKLFGDELHYLDSKLLLFDVRNNSAWNHRHFVISLSTGYKDIKIIEKEIKFCQKKIKKLANNHSVWYYYTQIIQKYLKDYCNNIDNNIWKIYRNQQIIWIQEILQTQPYASRAVLFYIDLLTDKDTTNINDLKQSITLLQLLGNKIDRIRYNYYNYLINDVEKQIKQLTK